MLGRMMKAVRYDHFGDVDVLRVADVERPVPGARQVLVAVKAAGINPGEAAIRKGLFAKQWPSTFPSGQGSDLAGVIAELGASVTGWKVGDEVIGFVHTRSSQAEFAVVDAENLVRRPAAVPWEVAGSLFVVGTTAWAAVQAVGAKSGETVVVSGAAGGVGSLTVQLARAAGANVIGIAGEGNHDWLRAHGVLPVTYGEGVEARVRAAAPGGRVDALIDTFGGGYVDLALALGVAKERIDTIIDWEAAKKHGVQTVGNAAGARAEVMAALAKMIADGRLEIPIAKVVPLAQVQDAYRELEKRHTRGKIVLRP